ncbi:tachylectin-2-like [Pleurodeles waltl]
MPQAETVLFAIDRNNQCIIALPPQSPKDDFNNRARRLGKLHNASHVFFNPKGHMFVVRGDELFKGPSPFLPWNDWFSQAKCVGRGLWDQCKFLYFNSQGRLFAVTKSGAWYVGPEPDNPHVPWVYRQAGKIGGSGWEAFDALFFDPDDTMYGVHEGRLRRNSPLSTTDGTWLAHSFVVGEAGWDQLSHFMGFSSDGNLWCVSQDGKMYRGRPPSKKDEPWLKTARNMGSGYNSYKMLAFTDDKTIQKVLSVEFLTDLGKVLKLEPEVVTEKVYDNKDSSTTLKATFEVNKVYIAESQFTHQHGFDFSLEAETTFEAGIPLVGKSSVRMSAKASTSHSWNFTSINRTETTFKMTSEFEVEPGKAVRQIAVAKKATVDVPYSAKVRTIFGHETMVSGSWKGVAYIDLKVKQSDE